jgi:hypothetical protein
MTYDPYQQYPPHQPDPYGYPPQQSDPYQVPSDPYQAPQVQPYSPPSGPMLPDPQPYSPPSGSMMPAPQPYMPPPGSMMPAPQPYMTPPPYGYAVPLVVAMPGRRNSEVAVWALVMGLIGIVTGWCLLGLPCIAAVILGHVGLADTKSGEKSGRGQAVAGLVLGYIALAPAVILFFWAFLGGVMGAGA